MDKRAFYDFLHATQIQQAARELETVYGTAPNQVYLHPVTSRFFFGDITPIVILNMRVHLRNDMMVGQVVIAYESGDNG